MRPYIISHMMTSVDGRIDCPMVGQLSTDEYYIALKKTGPLLETVRTDNYRTRMFRRQRRKYPDGGNSDRS